MKFRENEDAVSPVIGVILMVAITVILAAVIAAFVFGMASGVDTQSKNVAATAQLSGDYVVVTYMGGSDHDTVYSVTCSVKDAGGEELSVGDDEGDDDSYDDGDDTTSTISGGKVKVGHKWSVDIENLRDEGGVAVVTVSAKFEDGTESVILDKNIRVPKKAGAEED